MPKDDNKIHSITIQGDLNIIVLNEDGGNYEASRPRHRPIKERAFEIICHSVGHIIGALVVAAILYLCFATSAH